MSDKEKIFSSFVGVPVNFCPVIIGKICSVYGVLGWLKIVSFTEEVHDIMRYQPWFIKFFSKWYCVNLESWKKYRDSFRFLVKFKEIFDRDRAKLLSNHDIFVDSLQFPNLCDGEYYWKDIIGSRVLGSFNYDFGVVVDLIETGSNDVLVVKNRQQRKFVGEMCLIPFIKEVIKSINVLQRIISVNWDPEF